MGNQTNIFKLMDDYIVVNSKGEEKTSKIALPKLDTYQQHRTWADSKNIVYAVADNLKEKLNKGDIILLIPHCKLRQIDKLTKIMEDKLGKSFSVIIKDKKGGKLGEEETEKYFIVHVDDILTIVN